MTRKYSNPPLSLKILKADFYVRENLATRKQFCLRYQFGSSNTISVFNMEEDKSFPICDYNERFLYLRAYS